MAVSKQLLRMPAQNFQTKALERLFWPLLAFSCFWIM